MLPNDNADIPAGATNTTTITPEQQAALVELANAYLNAKPKIMFDAATQKITTPEGLVIQTLTLFGVKASIRDPEADEPKPTKKKPMRRSKGASDV